MTMDGLAGTGALLADPTRAAILAVLLGGRAHPAGELARLAGVAASTASEHLARLLDGGLVVVEARGRHRYYRLAGAETAGLLEAVVALDPRSSDVTAAAHVPRALRFARSCYDHLAGELGVALYDGLVDGGLLAVRDGVPAVTPAGARVLATLGIEADDLAARPRPLARTCRDWSQRRLHLAGGLGAALLATMLRDGWLARGTRPRALVLTRAGRSGLADRLGVRV